MSLQTFTRKMRGRMRSNTCRIVLLTSLVWVIFDFVLIAHYSDCIGKDGWRCRRAGEYDVEVSRTDRWERESYIIKYVIFFLFYAASQRRAFGWR